MLSRQALALFREQRAQRRTIDVDANREKLQKSLLFSIKRPSRSGEKLVVYKLVQAVAS